MGVLITIFQDLTLPPYEAESIEKLTSLKVVHAHRGIGVVLVA